jgi:hypothetical protein
MAGAALDHMLSLIVFIAAVMIFIGLFSQTSQSAFAYQGHSVLSTKTSDLLDTILLNPGLPSDWGKNDTNAVCFGLQDPEFSQYKVSSFSLMRLSSATESQVYYPRTSVYFNSLSAGFGSCLLAPAPKTLNYSAASKLLGINNTYGFQLTLTPTVKVDVQKNSSGAPLQFSFSASGIGYPMANTAVTYNLFLVNQSASQYPSYTIINGKTSTDLAGFGHINFQGVNGETQSYALVVYCYLNGLKGIGYYVHVPQGFTKSVVPLIDSFADRTVLIAHSDSVGSPPQLPQTSQLSYNATFVILTDEYKLRPVILDYNAFGNVVYGTEQDYASVTVPNNDGILVVTYKGDSAGQYGIVLMPWGLGSMAFPITFGGNPLSSEWVATDIRQVTIGGIAYQAKLALWSLHGYQGTG